MDDDAKKKILSRRAKFIAAALAGVACGKEPASSPQPCLSVVYVGDGGAAPADTTDTEQHMGVTSTGTSTPAYDPANPCGIAQPKPDGGCYPAPAPCLTPMAPTPRPTPKP